MHFQEEFATLNFKKEELDRSVNRVKELEVIVKPIGFFEIVIRQYRKF